MFQEAVLCLPSKHGHLQGKGKTNQKRRLAPAAVPRSPARRWPGPGAGGGGLRDGLGEGRPSECWKAAPGSPRRWQQPQHGNIKPLVTDYSRGPCRGPSGDLQLPAKTPSCTKSRHPVGQSGSAPRGPARDLKLENGSPFSASPTQFAQVA